MTPHAVLQNTSFSVLMLIASACDSKLEVVDDAAREGSGGASGAGSAAAGSCSAGACRGADAAAGAGGSAAANLTAAAAAASADSADAASEDPPTAYALTSPGAMALVGASVIRARWTFTEIEDEFAAKGIYREYTDDELREWLETKPKLLFGEVAGGTEIQDDGTELSLDLGSGTAYVEKTTGRWRLTVRASTAEPRDMQSAEAAVDAALDQLWAAKLVEMTDCGLEVLSTSATHMSGLPPDGGTSDVITGRRVTFGRHCYGLSVYGDSLRVSLDADGRISQVTKDWRDLQDEPDGELTLISAEELEARRNPDYVANLPLIRQECGYFDPDRDNTSQLSPAVGCFFVYEDPSAGGEMIAPERSEFINLSVDGQPPLPQSYL